MRHMQERNIISPEMIDNFTEDEVEQLTGLTASDTESDISVGKLGSMYHEQLMMYQQVAKDNINYLDILLKNNKGKKLNTLKRNFKKSTILERNFWECFV